ncbi:cystathionine beta-lyase [Comamonas sp. BIGb0124]|uniref:PLP-dependent transferase n=1 Tax=Comamonas sp. BIGb0124 TaxID=2485130 RepID=UPI000F4A4299|nr:PLP-dependent transferase [Comamonas sp. BIGb0124]ROR17204.1 cystathionine beta-lyase [Comamonas sp. BIGb0124]
MSLDLTTHLIHHPYEPEPGFAAPQPAVHKASTVFFRNTAAMRGADRRRKHVYSYGLHGTPTTFLLEERLAALEGGEHCVLVPSGLAAITLVSLALLAQGDEVLVPDNAYDPNKAFSAETLARWGIGCQLYDPMDPDDLASRIGPRTRLVWLEAPGSVTMEFPDLTALAAVCRARGVPSALDNTWGAGLAFQPFEAGVDLSVHALTKYPSGGGDVLMGSVVTRDAALHARVKAMRASLGLGVGVNDVETVLRSLPSMDLRYRAQDRNARALTDWLARRPEIVQVLHPARPDSPGHAHWQALCGPEGLAAGLFSVVFDARYGTAQVDAFCDALKLFKLGYSWGGPVSLVVPYDIASMRDPAVTDWPHGGVLVRLSLGFEAVADLRADLEQALQVLGSA